MCGSWPYENEIGMEEMVESDVLVLGGGLSGCYAAIAAARKGQSVVLVEKGAVEKSGSAGTGFDHWESACTNPCSGVSPEEIANAYFDEQDGYSNGISHYIECREGYDRLLDMESFGGKVRDTDGEFAGAQFRDDETGLMFAYDYANKFTLRVWGSTFKPALAKELKRLGVKVYERTEATALLVAEEKSAAAGTDEGTSGEGLPETGETAQSGSRDEGRAQAPKEPGRRRGVGAMGMNVRTGRFVIFRAKATVLCMSRPARVWLFDPDMVGLCEFRPLPSIGSGHAMGWRAGLEFTMMEKSVRAEFSAAGRSFPPYGTGNNHNTWYAATMVDARGVEIPYVDRDGRELQTVSERYYPAPGQKFFLKGGVIDNPKYEYRGPETLDFEELMKRGYQLPFFADLSRMPDAERRVIWGMMVGEEAKTKIPIYQNYTDRGFDPQKHMLQSYGTGWQSASFLDQERQFFGAPGGLMHDWDLKTNIDGIYAAGDMLYASDCAGHACATGYYAGRKAADYAASIPDAPEEDPDEGTEGAGAESQGKRPDRADAENQGKRPDGAEAEKILSVNRSAMSDAALREQIEKEKARLYAPLYVSEEEGIGWKELNMAISKAMQNYCGGVKCDALLNEGLSLLKQFEEEIVPKLSASNPHDLMRTHEVLDILEVAQLVLHACLARKASSEPLCFERTDYPQQESAEERRHIVIRQDHGEVKTRDVPLRFFGDLKEEYEKRNQDYMAQQPYCPPAKHEAGVFRHPVRESAPAMPGNRTAPEPEPEAGCGTNDQVPELKRIPALCSTRPLQLDTDKCIGCGRCAAVCPCDVLVFTRQSKAGHDRPEIAYPGECYYCGACVMVCPKPGALRLSHPLMNQARFVPVRKTTET